MEPILLLGGLTSLYIINQKSSKKKTDKVIYSQERNPLGFTKSIKDSINLIKLNDKDELKPVGSYRYKIHAYPSDIDIFEKYERCCSLSKVKKEIAIKFKTIAKNIKKSDEIFLGDFKLGIDYSVFFEYGEIDYNTLNIINYDTDIIKSKLKEFLDNKLINEEEYNQIISLVVKNISAQNFMKLNEFIRNLYILRWNLTELIKNKKKLRNGNYITIEDCLSHNTVNKIDIWAPINNNYTEITNFYYIIFKNRKGKKTFLSKELTDYIESLNNDIKKYESSLFRNSLKLAKRLWIKNNLEQKTKELNKLYPLFYSGAAKLNQIKEEIIVIKMIVNSYIKKNDDKLVENFNSNILPILNMQFENFKTRINDIFDLNINTDKIFNLLNEIIGIFNDKGVISNKKLEIILNKSDDLIDIIKPYIENFAYNYLIDNKLFKFKKETKYSKVGKESSMDNEYVNLEII